MESGTMLMFSLLFSSIGMGYFVYGKKQQRGLFLLSGILLMAFPYFTTSVLLFFAIGTASAALPFLIRA